MLQFVTISGLKNRQSLPKGSQTIFNRTMVIFDSMLYRQNL
jgi:hypothetical protein